MKTLPTLVPDPNILLSLAPEEVAGVILEIWDSYGASLFSMNDVLEPAFRVPATAYPTGLRRQILEVVAEAWSWLEREGLIMHDPEQPTSYFIRTRRGRAMKSAVDVEAYRDAATLPRNLLHPAIAEKVWAMFLRGDHDVAVFQAFKEIEVEVRRAAGLTDDQIGVTLMRRAFHPDHGPLADHTTVQGERQAMMDLFAGAIGHAKNPQSHRDAPVSRNEAAQLIVLASYLLRLVEERVANIT